MTRLSGREGRCRRQPVDDKTARDVNPEEMAILVDQAPYLLMKQDPGRLGIKKEILNVAVCVQGTEHRLQSFRPRNNRSRQIL